MVGWVKVVVSERNWRGNFFGKQKTRLGWESGLAVVFSGILPPERIVSAHSPSSPSRPVPACAFYRRRIDAGDGTELHGKIHRCDQRSEERRVGKECRYGWVGTW